MSYKNFVFANIRYLVAIVALYRCATFKSNRLSNKKLRDIHVSGLKFFFGLIFRPTLTANIRGKTRMQKFGRVIDDPLFYGTR